MPEDAAEDPTETELTLDLAREVLDDVAPQELPLFRSASDAYRRDPDQLVRSEGAKEDMLGFGMGEVMAFVTPAIIAAASVTVKFLIGVAGEAAKAGAVAVAAEVLKAGFKRWRGQNTKAGLSAPENPEATLEGPFTERGNDSQGAAAAEESAPQVGSREQSVEAKVSNEALGLAALLDQKRLAELRSVVLQRARDFHLPEPQAEMLADSMVGRLVLGGTKY